MDKISSAEEVVSKGVIQPPSNLLRTFLLPYAALLVLYLLVIGCGSTWLYLTARHAQTELITEHIIDVVSPFLLQLSEDHNKNSTPVSLSQKVDQLYKTLPHLRQISIRDKQYGYGVRLSFEQKLVDVELEPLLDHSVIITTNHQQLSQQLHREISPFFHIRLDLTSAQGNPVQMDIAFDRAGLVGQINNTLQSIIQSIIVFSSIGTLSILLAIAITIYTGIKTHKIEVKLQKTYQQAAMGNLAASLVHDLRNPLASIRANVKNLLITPEQIDQVVDEMDQDILRLEQKLTDFLFLTKPVNNCFKLINIEPLIDNVIKRCKPLLVEKDITISLSVADNIPKVTVISEDISDALFNLLVNAKNHCQQHGHIWISIDCQQKRLKIIVEDDGSGIPESLLTKIFNPFFTTRDDGHGLGLAIVKRTVETHDGIIFAENRLPSGARFIISLPLTHHA